MKHLLIVLILILPIHLLGHRVLSFELNDGIVTGVVIDQTTKSPLPFATIILKDSNDTYISGVITDDKGNFELENIAVGKYLLEIQFIGYQTYTQAIEISSEHTHLDLGTIAIQDIGQSLDEITIKADKPLYVQKVDRMVINVASSILATKMWLVMFYCPPTM